MNEARNGETRKIIGSLLTSAVLVVLFFVSLNSHINKTADTSVPGGWEIIRGDKTFENLPLEDMTPIVKDIKWNERVCMNHRMDFRYEDPLTLRIYARLSAIRVSIDGQQIYSYGFSDVMAHKMVGSGYHFVLLPMEYYGKELSIEILPSEDGALKSAPEISIIPVDEATAIFAGNRIFGTFSGIFMFAAGIFFILIAFVAITIDRSFYPILIIGAFSCSAGIWCLGIIKALQLFSSDITTNSIIEYLSMYFLPIPMMLITRYFRHSASPSTKKMITFYSAFGTGFFILAIILHFTGIKDVSQMAGLFHLMTLPMVTVLLFGSSTKWKRMRMSERMFHIGIICVAAMIAVEMLVYYIVNLIYRMSSPVSNVATPLAVLAMDVMVTLGFLMEIYDMRIKDAEREHLLNMAYRDQMTGFMNRGMCEKRFAELRESGQDFVILNMDLNGLKSVNDKYGHLKGDQYISIFSTIVSRVFGGDRNLYRVGGDEFLFVSTTMTRDELGRKVEFIKKLEKVIPGDNGIHFDVDAAFGIAGSDEVSTGEPEDVYRLADERMYRMKRKSSKERE